MSTIRASWIGKWWLRKLKPPSNDLEYDPYAGFEEIALWLKARAQMLIGATLFIALGGSALSKLLPSCAYVQPFAQIEPLLLVSSGLTYAAGIELCYMLYTREPDEAVNPVVLGLASVVVLRVAHDPTTLQEGLFIALLVGAMAVLFFLQAQFILPQVKAAKEAAAAKAAAAKAADVPTEEAVPEIDRK